MNLIRFKAKGVNPRPDWKRQEYKIIVNLQGMNLFGPNAIQYFGEKTNSILSLCIPEIYLRIQGSSETGSLFIQLGSEKHGRHHNGSQVQGSTFRVKDKCKIRNTQFSRQMLILPNNFQKNAKFQIWDDATNTSLANTLLKWNPGARWNFETLNFWTFEPLNVYMAFTRPFSNAYWQNTE